jgi:hypothetical protein
VALSINAGHGELVGPETADYIIHDALPSGTIIDCPSGASVENESITFRFKTASSVPISWDSCYTETAHLSRPTATSGNDTYDILKFIRDPTPNTWILVAKDVEGSGEVGTTFGIKEVSGGQSIVDNLVVPDGSLAVDGNTATLAFPTFTGAETLENKRMPPRITSQATVTSPHQPNFDITDHLVLTALDTNLTFSVPTYTTPFNGELRTITIKDDGTPRTLAWIGGAGGFVKEHAVAFPTTTVTGEWLTVQVRYNPTTAHWSIVGSTMGVEPLVNPMTTAGDFIVGGTGGIPTRAIGGQDLASILTTKTLTDNSAVNILQVVAANNTASSVRFDYAVEVLTATNDVQLEDGMVICRVLNQNGSLSLNTCTKTSSQSLGTGTLTTVWAISAANPAQVTLNADTSLTPSAGYPKLRYSALSIGGQTLTYQ